MVTSAVCIPSCLPYSVGRNVNGWEKYDTEQYEIVKQKCVFI